MEIDATFWVAISFIIFFVGLAYLKIPKKINEVLNKLILDIKNEITNKEECDPIKLSRGEIVFNNVNFSYLKDAEKKEWISKI